MTLMTTLLTSKKKTTLCYSALIIELTFCASLF